MTGRLEGYRILILETREEAQFSRLLADQGADVLQCPMMRINDAPDPAPVAAWIEGYIARPFDDLVLTTGEGLRRLMAAAHRKGIAEAFVASVAKSRTIARGPKPGKALREIGLAVDITTPTPTSEGIAALLADYDLTGRRLGLQLYPDKDHTALIAAIVARGADVTPVLPYVYDPSAADANILTAIDEMAAHKVDAIALTSSNQVRRLIDVAKAHGRADDLRAALARTRIASVGPVVSDELAMHGLRTDIVPADGAFFMKPLISAMAAALQNSPPRNGI